MSPRSAATGAVVVGGYVNALSVVRSLAALDVPIAVITTSGFDIAHRSRWCRERADIAGTPRFAPAVRELLSRNAERWKGRVVFPTNDPALLALAGLHDELPGYRLVAPSLEIARSMLRKDVVEAHARAIGIDTPLDYGPANPEACERADLRYPVVVKPLESHSFAKRFGCKLFFARDRSELADAVRRVTEAGLASRILDFVPGPDDAFYNYCVYVDAHGEVVAGLCMRKLRKSPPFFGVCRVGTPWPDDSLRDRTVELLRRIGYRGMANAEYKLDPRDGKMRLMEVNGRPFLMAGIARRAGIDLVRLAWAEAGGEPLPEVGYNGWRGHWIHLHPDLLYALLFRRTEKLGFREYVRPYLGSKAFAVWSLADPLPFAAQWSRTFGDALRMVVSRRRREDLRGTVQSPGDRTSTIT